MSDLFLEALGAVSNADFREKPVPIEEFTTKEEFLGLPPLSDYQYQMIRAGSQIYKEETLIALYGEEQGKKRFEQTCNEVILQLGKGSGKDYCSTIMCAYIAYLLCCLKDPAAYYGKPKGDTIDILNIAVNSDQARNVFFANLKKRIMGCHWFDGMYNPTQNSIEFENGVRIFSGHSEREAFEGLNLIAAVLDEISAFALESNTGNAQANTADATYKMYRASVDSRFPDFGKVILLSFPRFKNDYIQQRYNAVVAEKEVVTRSRTLKLEPDLPDGVEGNEVEVKWDEDHITRYKYPKMFALRRPTWEINPIVSIDSPAMVRAAAENYEDFLGRFAAMPSDNTDSAFIKNKQAIEDALILHLNVDNDGVFRNDFRPKPDTKYFMHVDLSKVHDRCSVALAHVDKWLDVRMGETYQSVEPLVVVDAIRWWKPEKFKPMDYEDVIKYILAVRQRGFDIKLVSFDRWNSIDTMNSLERHNIKTDTVSVAQKHYDDFLTMLYGQRLIGPNIEEFKEELRELQWIKGKVDHPRSGFKDITDSFIGAVHNAIEGTPKPIDMEVEVRSLSDLYKQQAEAIRQEQAFDGVIRPPKSTQQMPDDLKAYLQGLKIL